jgi:cyclase
MSFRICARLETKGNHVVKGYQLEGLRVVGELSELANTYYTAGVDELIVSDITSSWFSTQTTVSMLSKLIEGCFVPITIGGGIRTLDDVDSCLRAGAERVSINTASFKSPDLLVQIARKYGSQSIVVNLQAKKINDDYYCYFFNGRENTNLTLESFLSPLSCNVAGEILINSI